MTVVGVDVYTAAAAVTVDPRVHLTSLTSNHFRVSSTAFTVMSVTYSQLNEVTFQQCTTCTFCYCL